jgi:ClpP class serine protease
MPAADVRLLIAIASRSRDERAAARADEGNAAWQRRDYQLMAGPGAQRLPGALRAYLVDGVAVLPVTGPIFPRANLLTEQSGATSLTMLQNDYAVALTDKSVGAIMLLVDSPGGAVSGISAFADTVRVGGQRKPTSAYVSGTAASAAYWIATAASDIAMERTAMVGSIGVVAVVPRQVGPDQSGEIQTEIVSSNAPNKRPDATTEDGAGVIRATIDQLESQFISDVAKGRGVPVAKVRSDFGQGGVRVGADAVRAGMADRVGSYEAALRAARNSGRMRSLQTPNARDRLHVVGGSSARIRIGETQETANTRRMRALRP